MRTLPRSIRLALALSALAAPALAGPKLTGGSQSLPRHSVTGGGTLASAGGPSLNNGLAETGVSSFTGAGLKLYSGLMNLVAQPGSVVSITAVTKSTGELDLAWTAPGLDGPVGDVVGGYYRIDASSDPRHVFDPTVFVTEFATSVVAGSSQTFALADLQPNTTYYTRVYLADSRKFVAESSAQSDESTLANLPASPVLSAVYSSSVTFAWTPPADGAEGYALQGSSTAFGGVLPGGLALSSTTRGGLAVTLTITGLTPFTTYFFKLGSFNWQDEAHFTAIIATRTLPGGPLPPVELALSGNAIDRTVTLTWTNPVFANPAGVLVVVSTNPISAAPADGTAYPVATAFPDGSVVESSAAATSHLQPGLALDTTQYFSLFSRDTARTYSVSVSTSIVLDLPAMAPAGLAADIVLGASTVTLHWRGVTSNSDGSGFKSPQAPIPWEMDRYEVYQATGIVNSNWVLIGTAPATATSFAPSVPNPALTYYYKIVSRDAFTGVQPDPDATIVDTSGNYFFVAPDQVTRLQIPPSLAGSLRAGGNSYGANILIRAKERAADIGGRVAKSVEFAAVRSPSNAAAPRFQLAVPGAEVTLRYEVSGGQIVASAAPQRASALASLAPIVPAVSAADASQRLGMFWYNGQNYVKLFGRVDPLDQLVTVKTSMVGRYQLQTFVRDAQFSFDISQMSGKVITPNGDGLNDTIVWVFNNPRLSSFSGKIFDMRGAFVSDMALGPVGGQSSDPGSLVWDGKANGSPVPRGVYLYQIQAEGKTFNGTLVVIR